MVASDCKIVKKIGYLTKLWGNISFQFCWEEETYDDLFHLCVMLTNYHISFHPLCEIEDAVHYTCYKICNYMMVKNVTKRKMLQKQKNTEKNVPKIEEDFGASDDSSIGSYDSCLLEKINLFSGWMWS